MGRLKLIWVVFPAIIILVALSLLFGALYFHSVFNVGMSEFHEHYLERKMQIHHLELQNHLNQSGSSLCDFKSEEYSLY